MWDLRSSNSHFVYFCPSDVLYMCVYEEFVRSYFMRIIMYTTHI